MFEIKLATVLKELTGNLHLVTRPLGMKVRDHIISEIQSQDENRICLDFLDLGIIDYSGADEVIVRLITRLVNKELGDRYIVIRNLEQIHRDNVKVAFLIYKKHAVLEILNNNEVSYIGNLKPMLLDVFDKVYYQGIDTARQLADETNSEINLAGTKLLQLYQERLIMRREETLAEGGRQFTYYPVIRV